MCVLSVFCATVRTSGLLESVERKKYVREVLAYESKTESCRVDPRDIYICSVKYFSDTCDSRVQAQIVYFVERELPPFRTL